MLPVSGLVTLAAPFAVPLFVPLAIGVACLALPGLWLLSRRLRDPSREEVAEADGRRPVLVLHAFARSRLPLWRRLFFPTPGLLADVRDHRLEGALDRALSDAGPVLHLARPAAAASQGPVAVVTAERDAWRAALDERLAGARLVAIVIDATEENAHELDRASALVGPSRIVLVPPPEVTPELIARWEGLRARLPGLPPLDPSVAAMRFDAQVRPTLLGSGAPTFGARRAALTSAHVLRDHERSPAPRPPLWSWLFTAAPLLAAVVGGVAVAPLMQEAGARVRNGDARGFGLVMGVCAVLMAFASRRAMRLVPGGVLPIVLLAVAPWLTAELVGGLNVAFRSAELASALRSSSAGAAYAIPLLCAAAVVLAGSSLIRKSPGRSLAYGAFGLAPLIPFAALYPSANGDRDALLVGLIFLAPIAVSAILVAVAASGDAGRRHAPLPIGAAACVGLAAAAFGVALAHDAWRDRILQIDDPGGLAASGDALETVSGTWPWFALAVPGTVALLAMLFHGRASRPATTGSLSLVVMGTLIALAVTADGSAAAWVSGARALRGDGALLAAAGPAVEPGFRATRIPGARPSPGAVDLVIDRGGAIARGRRVATAAELMSAGGTAFPRVGAAVGPSAALDGHVRIAPEADASGEALRGAVDGAIAAGATTVEVVGRADDGRLTGLELRPPPRPGALSINLVIVVRPDAMVLTSNDGTYVEVSEGRRGDPRPDLDSVLRDRRRYEPNRAQITVAPAAGASVERTLAAAAIASRHYDRLALGPAVE